MNASLCFRLGAAGGRVCRTRLDKGFACNFTVHRAREALPTIRLRYTLIQTQARRETNGDDQNLHVNAGAGCVAGVGTAQITVGLNIGSVGEKSDDVRYVRVPDHKELGSKYFAFAIRDGTALFGLIMTHKHCEMEKPVMNMLQMTIQELAQALNYQTNINNEVSKTFETDATALSNRFQPGNGTMKEILASLSKLWLTPPAPS